MSLNKYEQALCDYLEHNLEEGRHWKVKVAGLAARAGDRMQVARDLERELWHYYVERAGQVARLRELNLGGVRRVSLQNLSEYLLRLYGPTVPARPAGQARSRPAEA